MLQSSYKYSGGIEAKGENYVTPSNNVLLLEYQKKINKINE
jgi:hypothetical protein